MLSAISQWVRQIVIVVMFAAFVDFLIPENNFLKYVKVFLGLLVMIVILNPLIPFFQSNVSFDEIPFIYEELIDNKGIIYESDILNKTNNELTIAEYKAKIENYFSQKIAEITSYDIKNVTVKINEDFSSQDFGKINQIEITVSKNSPNPLTGRNLIQDKISINKVKIDDKLLESSALIEKSKDEFKEIINYLTLTFDIPEENIFLSLED